mgnify:CR=1 FL=1
MGFNPDRQHRRSPWDFVFVGDVGRPDLLERAAHIAGTMEAGARTLYASLQRFKALPDWLQIWPGHGAGSACGTLVFAGSPSVAVRRSGLMPPASSVVKGVITVEPAGAFIKPLNASQDAGIFGQYFGGHIGQANFAFQNFALYCALKYF